VTARTDPLRPPDGHFVEPDYLRVAFRKSRISFGVAKVLG